MRLLINTTFLLFAGSFSVNAQDMFLISCGGNFFANSAGSVSWSVGEPIIKTASSPGNDVTQGFQQGNIYVTGIEELSELKISVFPNPASDIVTISSDESAELNMYDMSGRMVLNQLIEIGLNTIDVSIFERGTYSITVLKKGSQPKIVKLIIM